MTVVYAPPGAGDGRVAASSVEYGSSSQLGTSVSVNDSFKYDQKITAEAGFLSVSTDGSFDFNLSSANQTTTDLRITTLSALRYSGPRADGIDHDFDLIYLWLNPVVNLTWDWSTLHWSLGVPNGERGEMQYVYVGWLKNPARMPMPTGVSQALESAGITAVDYPAILANDPLVEQITDTSASTLDKQRFVPLNTTFPYEPPAAPNGTPPSSALTLTTTTSRSDVSSSGHSYSVGFSIQSGFDVFEIFKAKLKDENTWTWTSTQSTTSSTSNTQTASLTITGPAYGYSGPTEMAVYWDNVYRAFLFVPYEQQQTPAGLTTSGSPGGTVSGIVSDKSGTPLYFREVSLIDVAGQQYRTFTNSRGEFHFDDIPAGTAKLIGANETLSLTVQPGNVFYTLTQ